MWQSKLKPSAGGDGVWKLGRLRKSATLLQRTVSIIQIGLLRNRGADSVKLSIASVVLADDILNHVHQRQLLTTHRAVSYMRVQHL